MPDDSDFDPLRAWARARATEGLRLEDLLRAFAILRQLGWAMLRRHARSGESEALLTLAGRLGDYLDRTSLVVTETYLAERELLVSEEERHTRTLLDLLCSQEPLTPAAGELAERLGVPLQSAYSAFAVVIPGSPPHRHAALAARLRQAGWRLAVTQSDRVVGASWKPLRHADLNESPDALLVIGEPVPRSRLGQAREDVEALVEHARRAGMVGEVRFEDHLLETIVERSSELARRLSARLLASLDVGERSELAHTLSTFLDCRMDRTLTSSSLQIHRNTLAYRLGRIEQLTGLDLGAPRDLACSYVALKLARADEEAGEIE